MKTYKIQEQGSRGWFDQRDSNTMDVVLYAPIDEASREIADLVKAGNPRSCYRVVERARREEWCPYADEDCHGGVVPSHFKLVGSKLDDATRARTFETRREAEDYLYDNHVNDPDVVVRGVVA